MKRKYIVLAALCAILCAQPARAQMHHYEVGAIDGTAAQKPAPPPDKKPGDDAEDYGGGSFSVTPVQDCFKQLKPGEAADIRKNSATPYEECEARLKARAAEKEKKDKLDKDKKDKDKTPPVQK